jgi:hypothetical protein
MANPVIIETESGAQYSVVESDFKKHYPDTKYKVVGEETPADFLVTGVPQPKVKRSHARKKAAAPIAPVETAEPGE